MRQRKATLCLAAFLAFLALPLAVQAASGSAKVDPAEILHNPKALARYLKLTPDQIKTTQQLLTALHTAVEPLRAKQESLDNAFKAALQATPQNACAIGDAAIAAYANKQKIKAAVEDFDTKFEAILNPDQLAKWEALEQLAGGVDP